MKTKRKILTLLIAGMTFTCDTVFGQISQGGVPYSFEADYKRKTGTGITLSDTVPVIKMPQISKSAIDSIKEKNKRWELFQFAYGFETDIDVKQTSVVDSLDVGLLYRLSVKSSNAYSLNLIFKKFKLPKGAKLFIYSKDKQDLKGAFTSNNNKESEILPTVPVEGDEITVEYFEPYFSEFKGELIIGKVSHDFVDVLNTENCDDCDDFGSSGDCQVDINCQEGDDWQDEKRSVLRILRDGDTWCSGVLLNNTNEDGTPYVLTANHCTCEESDIDKYCFIFNYESPSCNGPDGSIDQSISGGTLRATRAESDFTLIELSLTPLSTYTPFYAGWDRNDAQDPGGVGIHHPSGDVKKISTFTMAPENSECFDINYAPTGCNSTFYPNDNFYQINWVATANGHSVTEGASSGSPLFNNDGRVIGQLFGAGSCDNPNCNDPANDNGNYGKIFSSWDDGNDASERLRDWLNPQNGVFAFDGISGCGQGMAVNLNITHTITDGSVELHQATNTITANNSVASGATATYEAETVILTDGFVAEAGSNFIARSRDFNCVVTCDPISIDLLPNVFTPNGDGVNDQLCYPVSNATSFEFEAYNRWGTKVFSSSGSVSGNQACVWNGTGSCSGCSYAVIITFKSQCEEVSEAYTVTVFSGSGKRSGAETNDTKSQDDDLLLNIFSERDAQNLDLTVFPNPTGGNFTLKVNTTESNSSYQLEIFSSSGTVLYKIEQINVSDVKIDKSSFPNGIYYVRLNDGKSVVTKKVVIQ